MSGESLDLQPSDAPVSNGPGAPLSAKQVADFRQVILAYYRRHGRDLPWRRTTEPYHILVSEVMLQQTQVERVLRIYPEFISRFPSLRALAGATVAEVVAAWQGLGYNRRALALQRAAHLLVKEHGGTLPRDEALLATLPGIGPATAASICAFAFNMPTVFVETNIRTVFIHFFFPQEEKVPDAEILPLVAATLERGNPRLWYSALMDYGVMLKKRAGNLARRSASYRPQSGFAGSDRQVRGQMLRLLLAGEQLSIAGLAAALQQPEERVARIADALVREGFAAREDGSLRLR
ncbi:MAG: A/G-specific adenine glycosylase [bacterium]|jgi:A/G-specific adenine glycosylase|nr:A/G-specific adenine glycosylase [candidate division KSB1 bacterium]MDH7559802.1 A/G-specific adenine glycosylase [bacterium]